MRVAEGKLRGRSETLLGGEVYYSFKGIPYASPPIGDLRFKVNCKNLFYIIHAFKMLLLIINKNITFRLLHLQVHGKTFAMQQALVTFVHNTIR